MTDNITEIPRKCNYFRDISKCFDTYEAYTILVGNKLIKSNFIFFEELIDNFWLHSYGTHTKIRKDLLKL